MQLPNRIKPKPVTVERCCICENPPCICNESVSCIQGNSLVNVIDNWVNLDAHTTEIEKSGCFK